MSGEPDQIREEAVLSLITGCSKGREMETGVEIILLTGGPIQMNPFILFLGFKYLKIKYIKICVNSFLMKPMEDGPSEEQLKKIYGLVGNSEITMENCLKEMPEMKDKFERPGFKCWDARNRHIIVAKGLENDYVTFEEHVRPNRWRYSDVENEISKETAEDIAWFENFVKDALECKEDGVIYTSDVRYDRRLSNQSFDNWFEKKESVIEEITDNKERAYNRLKGFLNSNEITIVPRCRTKLDS